ncbi:hypothetical protein CHU_2548 [Sporocytophaga myxococcoides]|uniref:DUF4272 domain-containing protein n=1 Tax=Sporocytophaga myxococcoides TaxID=153721 RepID=A0A098LKI7_9BACT|nr:DUF4272 domain-containing protein [Sporocytophaga myxococcoides]GAL87480.1 hypothetical protein CHU_2548 [Sporocytophaga myxococcoides]
MTASERKKLTENFLSSHGLPVFDNWPPLEEENDITLKTPQEIAERILILSYLNCTAFDPGLRNKIIGFLHEEGLWDKISLQEKLLFEKSEFNDDEIAIIAWRAESIWILLWSINKSNQLNFPPEEVNFNTIFEHLPPFLNNAEDFITSATLRHATEILDQADLLFRLNWTFYQAHTNNLDIPELNQGIVFERYFAINWVINFRKTWDE